MSRGGEDVFTGLTRNNDPPDVPGNSHVRQCREFGKEASTAISYRQSRGAKEGFTEWTRNQDPLHVPAHSHVVEREDGQCQRMREDVKATTSNQQSRHTYKRFTEHTRNQDSSDVPGKAYDDKQDGQCPDMLMKASAATSKVNWSPEAGFTEQPKNQDTSDVRAKPRDEKQDGQCQRMLQEESMARLSCLSASESGVGQDRDEKGKKVKAQENHGQERQDGGKDLKTTCPALLSDEEGEILEDILVLGDLGSKELQQTGSKTSEASALQFDEAETQHKRESFLLQQDEGEDASDEK